MIKIFNNNTLRYLAAELLDISDINSDEGDGKRSMLAFMFFLGKAVADAEREEILNGTTEV